MADQLITEGEHVVTRVFLYFPRTRKNMAAKLRTSKLASEIRDIKSYLD